MIKSVQIKNFQSHKNSKLEFDKGVNVIVGSSDSGKTAIIRAMRLALFNSPAGDAFRSHWGGTTSVKIETDTSTIKRIKGTKNLYKLNDTKFAAFGVNVPDTIKDVLNVSEINLKQQFENHFLLDDSSGAVAKFFNGIAHFGKIDTSLQFINSKVTAINSRIKHNEEDIKEKEKELLKYKGLKKLEYKVVEIETFENDIKVGYEDVDDLDALIAQLNYSEVELAKFDKLLALKPKVDELLELFASKKKESDAHFDLASLVLHLTHVKEDIQKTTKLTKLKKSVTDLLSNLSSKAILQTNYSVLSSLLQNIQLTNKNALNLTENTLKLKTQFHKEMGNQCILCNATLKLKTEK